MNKIIEYPKIGIGVTSYNSEKYIAECMDCLLSQSYDNLKIIVCDDHSSDDSPKILDAYAKNNPKKIQVVINQKNIGIQGNCNKCLHGLDTPYATLIAGDDIWSEKKVELEINTIERMGSRWVYSQLGNIDSDSTIIDEISTHSRGYADHIQLLKATLSHKVRVFNWLAEKSLIEEIGFLNENYKYVGDWEFNVHLVEKSMPAFVPSTTVYYRQHRESITSKGNYITFINEFKSVYSSQRKILERFSIADRKEILSSQRLMLKTIVHNGLLSSLLKRDVLKVLYNVYLKFKYKLSPLPNIKI
jgi:glycosyltransferase involved in cell wall biosynthesis